ncbi:hypothetical protein OG895_36420 [Streptomyces sp. NBC_00201]|nr:MULTISPECIES: hypothetical protein [unclassified Streptomyces]MCX5250626.1 hypothetical protein [Streptomyces sp. NBC_00201]MCX5291445.1 hypothetical protein [Streptomyces sp. NBC_00183]
MTAVMLELGPTRTEESDEIVVIDDVDTYTADAGAVPGCGDDNPYN